MKKRINSKESRGIMSLMVVLVIGLFALAAALTATGQMVAEIVKGTNTISGDRSFHTAEAASREGVYQYIKDTSYAPPLGSIFPELINESSDLVYIDEADPIFTFISSDAENNLTQRTVKYKLERIPGSQTFSYAIFTTGEITLGGGAGLDINCDDSTSTISCGDFSLGASVFSNEQVTLNGAPRIEGGVYSADDIIKNGTDNFIDDGLQDKDDGITKISFPTIDLQPYYYEADTSTPSTLFSTAADANTYLDSNNTGTVFIEDTGTTIINGKALDGTLVTLGNLDLRNGTYGTTDLSRAAIIVEGNLDIRGGTIINGIIYVKGITRFFGDSTINGALISVGEVDTSGGGSIEINYNPDISQEFENLVGLDKTPKLVGWQEE